MRSLAVAILLLASVLMAETQQAAYLRAMQAEEVGDIPAALKAFEEAVLLPGPYTEEIQEIIAAYHQAMGLGNMDSVAVLTADTSDKARENQDPLSFRFLGDFGLYGLHYEEYGGVDNVRENGGDLFLNFSGFLDLSTKNWLHSFGVSATGDWFMNNESMPTLDTCDWKLTLGLEYSLVGRSLLLDVGLDLNTAEGKEFQPAFYGWLERDFFRFEKQRIGAAGWAYYDVDGPLSFALYVAWHRTVVYGWNGSAYLGMRFEADSVMDYKQYLADYDAAYDSVYGKSNEGFDGGYGNGGFYGAPYGGNIYGGDNWGGNEDPFGKINGWEAVDTSEESSASISVRIPRYYGKWIGPTLRSKVSYKFRTKIAVQGLLNLFYGFVVDGPDFYYERIKKFNGTWGLTVSWKPGFGSVYLGMEQLYRHLDLPSYYKGIYAESSFLTELKAGVKWEI